MQWNKGAIHEAIATAKARKKIFLVYIEGTDEASKSMSENFNSPAVLEAFGDDCISIKLEANSVECQQFRQIYPINTIPSTFFIGTTGIPLEISAGSLEQGDFIAKIQKARELHRKSVEGHTSNATPSQMPNATSHQIGGASQATQRPEPTITSPAATDREMASAPTDASEGAPLVERIERANQLIAEKKEQRMKDEAEKERQKELDYRKMGKEMQKSRAQREQQEMQEWAQSRKKERDEERLARERVRAQIAQDRAERAERSMPGNVEETKKEETSRSFTGPSDFHGDCIRIQLRLPDGATAVQEFPTGATLADVHQFIVQDVRPAFSHFVLTTTFPRRQFQQQEYSQTLVSLGLAPSAVILLVPEKSIGLSGPKGQTLWALLSTVLSPIMAVWTYFTSFFRPNRPGASSQQPVQNRPVDSRASNMQGSDQSVRRRQRANEAASYRRDGNIHRLPNSGGDSDEENNTWNGNSTQQL